MNENGGEKMNTVGYMTMPEQFSYREVFLLGKPQHDPYDRFTIKHPPMNVGRRAKIFSPFDALKGFNETVASKEVLYTSQIELTEEEKDELNRKLTILHNLTYNSRMARQNHVEVIVTYYIPCNDVNHDAYRVKGVYKTITGVCWKVDPDINQEIVIGNKKISFQYIKDIEYLSDVFADISLAEEMV